MINVSPRQMLTTRRVIQLVAKIAVSSTENKMIEPAYCRQSVYPTAQRQLARAFALTPCGVLPLGRCVGRYPGRTLDSFRQSGPRRRSVSFHKELLLTAASQEDSGKSPKVRIVTEPMPWSSLLAFCSAEWLLLMTGAIASHLAPD